MSDDYREDLLRHYQGELSYLRKMGAGFAETYPKVAGRLDLAGGEGVDPHVERLLEGFAFLTARLQQNLNAEFAHIPQALLGVLYPQFAAPIPSTAIAQFDVDAKRGKQTGGYRIARGTQLFTESPSGSICRFQTCAPLTLWPVTLRDAALESPNAYDFLDGRADVASVLRLSIDAMDTDLSALGLDRLRFFLGGERARALSLYDYLVVNMLDVVALPDGDRARRKVLGKDALAQVGFEDDEAVLETPSNGRRAYGLLQEFFACPDKFLFLELQELEKAQGRQSLDILILLSAAPGVAPEAGSGAGSGKPLTVEKSDFLLGCVPVVNLFQKSSEPIRIDHKTHEYRITPDLRRERSTEIHSILSVTASNIPEEDAYRVEPFFSFNHAAGQSGREASAFWMARRRATERPGQLGSDMMLSFLDLGFEPSQPAATTVFAHMMCTNRGLAEQLMTGARLHIEEGAPVGQISLMTKPTPQRGAPIGGETLWQLVSQLSLNHLSLSEGEQSLIALQEMLRVHAGSQDPATEKQIRGLSRLTTTTGARRVGGDAWRGFVRGTEITLEVNERAFDGGSAILMASILDRFFALYADINTYTRLEITSSQRQGVWKAWPPRVGDQRPL